MCNRRFPQWFLPDSLPDSWHAATVLLLAFCFLPALGCGYSSEPTLSVGGVSRPFSPDGRHVYFGVRVHYYRKPTGLLKALNFGGNVKDVYEGVDFFQLDRRTGTLEAIASYAVDSLGQKQGGVFGAAYGIEAYRARKKRRPGRAPAALYAFVDVTSEKQALRRLYFRIDPLDRRLHQLAEARYESLLDEPDVHRVEEQLWLHVWIGHGADGRSIEALRFEDDRKDEEGGRVIGEGTSWIPHSF